ncbi:BatD family protein [Vibrio crassostreae]|uniref:BatD family protein n=1 Tax=Vibrio crassostreae TaxID=246167 RepID=UPI00104D7D5E|nr:BatD family protein [Vibrio crassostreae]TCO05342.1 oxygen tolerance protein BatD [Vibrio crassostreae]CAK1846271.1 Oxygen tolerance protein BatD [Vibrio crassostreae]CAK1859310.1 Oxygen tolerance protein BatD [Vibrio crassostreae]CAK1867370.1 Oxygen tolerance protein BatD [Vibrio crassostreae]CAK2660494.1 Oxygen tolerance protein BatD [Vibrio crassostreae]
MRFLNKPFLSALLTLLLGAFSSFSALAANAVASVSHNSVTKDEVFLLRVATDEKVSSDALDLTALQKDFYVGTPSFGSSMRIVNGSRSVSSEWNISLAPLRLGKVQIPSFDIEGAKTKPITINVAVNKAAPTQHDMAEFQLNLSKDSLYPQEVAELDVKLIIKADPRRLQDPKIAPPSSPGLDVEPIGESKQFQDVINGQEVTVVQQSFHISSQQAGQFQLQGPKLTGAVVYSTNNSSTTRLFQLDTPVETLDITVNPVPKGYQGEWLLTSNFKLIQKWSDSQGNELTDSNALGGDKQKIEMEAGDSLTRTITMTASNLTQHQLPKLNITYPKSMRVYEEKPQFGTTQSGNAIVVYKQVLIPKESGSISLPDVSQTWFNTDSQSQETSKALGLELAVKASERATSSTPPVTAPPTQQVSPTVVTVDSPGFWPYLTALFAALWLISSAVAFYFWSRRGTTAKPKRQDERQSDTAEALITSLKAEDGVMTKTLFEQWKTENSDLSGETLETIEAELNKLNQSLYAEARSPSQTWDPALAIKAVKKPKRISNKAHKSTLERL